MTKQNTRNSGNFYIGRFNLDSIALAPLYSEEIFSKISDKNVSRRSNVLFYADSESIDEMDDSSMYLAFSLARDPYFDVAVSTNKNPDLARNADVVIPRFNPPVSHQFLDELEKYDDGSRLFINSPKSQRFFSDKSYLESIANSNPEILPETIVSSNSNKMAEFLYDLRENGKSTFIFKPIFGYGGDGIEKYNLNNESFIELQKKAQLLSQGNKVILQEYIDKVSEFGDKRIHLVNGNPIGGAIRYPKNGDFRCNVTKGGSYQKTKITDYDHEIIGKIRPILEEKGVYWAGIDIVGPYLGEINAVSPGLLYEADNLNNNLYGRNSVANRFHIELKKSLRERVEREKSAKKLVA